MRANPQALTLPIPNFETTAGVDHITGSGAPETVLVRIGTLNAGDEIDMGLGQDSMVLLGTGSYDITAPAIFRGVEIISGGEGAETLIVSQERLAGVSTIDLLTGNDAIRMAAAGTLDLSQIRLSGVERIYGTAGNDVITGSNFDDWIVSNGGNDRLSGGLGSDTYEISDVTTVIVEDPLVVDPAANTLASFDRVVLNISEANPNQLVEYKLGANLENLTGSFGLRNALSGNEGNNIIVGGSKSDSLFGLAGDDTLTGLGGNNLLDGGAGTDRAVIEARFDQVTLTRLADGAIDLVRGSSGVDTLVSIERVVLTDGVLMLDQGASGVAAWRVMNAVSGTTPVENSLTIWRETLDRGIGITTIANSLMQGVEFQRAYGDVKADTAFVDALYRVVLHRAADAGGRAAQLEALDHGMSRAQMLVNFAWSGESIGLTGKLTDNGLFVAEVGVA